VRDVEKRSVGPWGVRGDAREIAFKSQAVVGAASLETRSEEENQTNELKVGKWVKAKFKEIERTRNA